MTDDIKRNSIKTAWKMLVHDLGGVDATAAACGISRSLVSNYGNRNSDYYPPAQTIIAAESVASEPLVTAALARAQGRELVLVEAPRGRGELASLFAALSKDVGELFATAAHALTHDKLTPKERADLLRELDDMRRIAGETMVLLQQDDQA
ncbi:MAG: hypothetical protein KGH75_11925 [Rhodospirillales bacterium]|nr:hypothetical protein [Rhodospirillales bacterium]